MSDSSLTFLKLGGSLITDKDQPESALPEQIHSLLAQIADWQRANPSKKLLLGHGSGSFGHHAAARAGLQQGVHTPEQKLGYQQVWYAARRLNQIIIEQAQSLHLPLVAFPPSASVTTNERHVQTWNLQPLQSSLNMGLIPLVYGDVVSDLTLGGTILSTEDLFVHLARSLHPNRILLAGKVEGVFSDYPANQLLLSQISCHTDLQSVLHSSASLDVTGGMLSKVQSMQALCRELPGLSVQIFSAVAPGALQQALAGSTIGTIIH